ncbi:Ig-like domain-containing protein [Shewanella sp. GD04112]|uniref:Ig-like domain-containing protein n=1 Tax=Shewanella sp. GD04112 TaxID=2975434 RepID=UPI00244721AC|nr:Ig-like domain-containing protein [Shewanella sp. GD04112]MDH0450886.1 Ig-like domain-containing protein [Shewanella sp. GD04112]
MNFSQHRYKLLAAALLALPHFAFAEIEGMTFTSVMQEQTTLTAASAMAINPVLAQSMNVYVSAGLDRKLKLYWLSSGVKLNEVTTGIVSVSDRLTFSGKDFYGKSISIKAPSTDGSFILQADLLSADGTRVGGWSVPVVIDTTAPSGSSSNISYAMNATGGSVQTYYPGNFGSLKLAELTDSGSGLKRADYIVKSITTGNVIGSRPAQYDTASFSAYISDIPQSLFTEGRTWYQAGFRVFDDAGNYTDITTKSFIDFPLYSNPTISDVYDEESKTWIPYTAGMVVHKNPFKVRYKRLYSQTKEFNTDWGWSSYGYREGDYIYDEKTISYPHSGSTYWAAVTPSGYYVYTYLSGVKVTLADGVERTPVQQPKTVEWFDDSGNFGGPTITSGQYRKVVKIRLNSESMPYEQLAVLSGVGSCVIPSGSTNCEFPIDKVFSSGYGYTPYTYWVYSSVNGVSDNRFSSQFSYWYTYWDFIPPTIESIETSNDSVIVNVFDTNTASDWRFSMWKTNVFRLQSSLGAELSQDSWVETGTGKHRVTFKLNKLPNGRQNISFYAEDSYGNRVTQLVLSNYLNDTLPPTLQLQSPTGALISSGSTINGLENLRISMTDDSDASITSVVLAGGAASDSVYVSTNSLGNGLYDLNYPRLFPSLEANETYTIKITATDVVGNSSTLTSSFMYLPANLLQVGQMTTLAVNKQLQNTQNKPITSIKTGVLRTAEGQLAAGAQTAFITLRSDAKINVSILGNVLQPGETQQVTITPDISGEVEIPVYSASPGVIGQASFMIDIPQITSNN